MIRYIVTVFHLEDGRKTGVTDIFKFTRFKEAFEMFGNISEEEQLDLQLSYIGDNSNTVMYTYDYNTKSINKNKNLTEERFEELIK